MVAKNGLPLQNHKHVPQLLGHDVLGGYLLGKAQAFELLFTRILLHAIGSLWGRWLAKFAQLILTHYNNRSWVFPAERNWIKERASNLSSGFFNNQLAISPSLEIAEIAE